jgi:FkbM family methyltransferase
MNLKKKIKNIGHRLFGYPPTIDENISLKVIRKYLKAHSNIIDCGAHDGRDSIRLQKQLNATIFSFEPVPRLFEILKKNTEINKRIIPYNIALSDEIGYSKFYVSSGETDASSSLLKPSAHLQDHPSVIFEEVIQVKTDTLDVWAKTNKIERIDMLWLDMQGFEMQMLKASPNILSTVKVIHTEVSTKNTYQKVHQYLEYKNFLNENGFEVKLEAIPNGWDMGNVLFVRN